MFSFRQLIASAFVLILPVLLMGQKPEPFKFTPDDAGMIVRMDYEQFQKNSATAPIYQQLLQTDPNFASSAAFSDDPELMFLAQDFPGEPKVEEQAVILKEQGQLPESPYHTIHGIFEPAKILEKLQQAGWTEAGKAGELTVFKSAAGTKFMTMPTSWTILFADSMENLQKMVQKGSSEPSASSPAPARVSNSIVYLGGKVTPEMRQSMQQMVQEQGAAGTAIPGGPQFLKELPNVESFTFAFGGNSGLSLNASAKFPLEQSAQNLAAAGNMMLPFMFQMMMAQVQQTGDQQAMTEIQQIAESTRFSASGNEVRVALPIPKSAVDALAAYMGSVVAMGAQQPVGGMTPQPGVPQPVP